MQFKSATDRATGSCITLQDIAAATGVTESTIQRARMDPENPNARNAPSGWEKALAKLARARSGELLELAVELEGGP